MNDTIERRELIACSCGCGKSAVLGRFRIIDKDGDRFPVLPEHEEYFHEKHAATTQLAGLIAARKPWLSRLGKAPTLYRLQMVIRNNRPLAIRSAAIFSLPVRLGLILARRWKLS